MLTNWTWYSYNEKENLKSSNKHKLQMSSNTISANSQGKNRLNNKLAEENTAEPLKNHENRVHLASVSVSTKGEK